MIPSMETNHHHALNPEPGDYWHERFCPVGCVVQVTEEEVWFAKAIRSRDALTVYFDTQNLSKFSRQEFIEFLRYGDIPGYWADVIPHRYAEAIHRGQL